MSEGYTSERYFNPGETSAPMNQFNVQYLFGVGSSVQVHQCQVGIPVNTDGGAYRWIDNAGGFYSDTDGKWIPPSAITQIEKL